MKQFEICFSTDFLREMCIESKGFSTLQLHRDRVLFMFSLFWVHFSPFSVDSDRFLQDNYIWMLHSTHFIFQDKLSHSLGPFPIYQVRSTSLDSDFCRVSTVMYSIVHFYPIASSLGSLHGSGPFFKILIMFSFQGHRYYTQLG